MAGIFRAYDIRGIYNKYLTDEIAFKIGRLFVLNTKAKKVVVGHDIRVSGVRLRDSMIRGITDQGCDVVDIGLCTTPMHSFACGSMKLGGVMITASHNPSEYNGFKFYKEGTIPVTYDDGLSDIEKGLSRKSFPKAKKGKVIKKDITQSYVKFVLGFAKKIRPFKIVIDAGNGVAGPSVIKLFEKLPCKITKMYFSMNGKFPNHEPNPLEAKNVKDLRKKVVDEKADLGAAFDGDADRVVFIDEKGEIVEGSIGTAIIAQALLKHKPGSVVLCDLRSSKAAIESIDQSGGKVILSRVGHSFIKANMRERDAIMAGELSGHYYFKEAFFSDNSLIALVLLLNNLSHSGKKLSETVSGISKYFGTGEISLKVNDKDKMKLMKTLEHTFSNAKRMSYLDGLSCEFDNWWFNVRQSNTEPLVRIVIEAHSKRLLDKKRKEVLSVIKGK